MFNKSQMFKEAHAAAKANMGSKFCAGRTYAELFAIQLRRIWSSAKMLAKRPLTIADHIVALESKDRWTRADYARHDELRAQMREAA